MRVLIGFIFLLSSSLHLSADNAEDVLKYYRFFEKYKKTNDSLKTINLNKAFDILQKDATIGLGKTTGLVYFHKGYEFYNVGDYDNCLNSFFEAEKNFLYIGDSCLLKDAWFNIGNVISVLGNNRVAIDYLQKSKEIPRCENTGSSDILFHYNLGLLLSSIKLHKDALKEHKTALTFDFQTESDELNRYLAKMAVNYELYKLGFIDSAILGHHQVLSDPISHKYSEDILYYGYRELGTFHIAKNNIDSAEFFFEEARKIEKTGFYQEYKSMDLVNLMQLNLAKQNFEKVIELGKKAITITQKLGNNERTRKILQLLTSAHLGIKNWKGAFLYKSRLSQLNDSLRAENIKLDYLLAEINKSRSNEIKLKESISTKRNDIDSLMNWLVWLGSIVVLTSILIIVLVTNRNKIKQLNSRLLESNQRKDTILTTLTHDIRTPLIDTTNLLKLVEMKALGEKDKDDMIESVKAKIDVLLLNVDSILHWSIGQINNEAANPQMVKVDQIVASTVSFIKNQASAKNVGIDITKVDNQEIFADENQLIIVLRNILGNAVKFSRPNTSVSIETSNQNDFVDISIADNGPGLTQQEIGKIMKGDSVFSSKENKNGTGVGLKLVKQYLALNNGILLIKSTVGEGATFTVRLKKPA